MMKPVWMFRIVPPLALVLVGVSMLTPSEGFWHGLCLGAVVGLMLSLMATGFRVQSVEMKGDSQDAPDTGLMDRR